MFLFVRTFVVVVILFQMVGGGWTFETGTCVYSQKRQRPFCELYGVDVTDACVSMSSSLVWIHGGNVISVRGGSAEIT